MSDKKVYLGDAVYARHDGYSLILTTEDGIRATNEIYLEPQVVHELLAYLQNLGVPYIGLVRP
jgi:hypothetical protein